MLVYKIFILKINNILRRLRFFFYFRKKGWMDRGVNINSLGKLDIGRGCIIGKNVNINIAQNGFLEISENVSIGANSQIEVEKAVQIGSNVTLSNNVFIADVTHKFPTVSIDGYRKVITLGTVVISEGCWLGRNVFVNPGCSISDHNIIAANSVVTKTIIDSWGLYGGTPAKLIKDIDI
jgi:acetyltransferase-like isoleucine patch superfamily enzyme